MDQVPGGVGGSGGSPSGLLLPGVPTFNPMAAPFGAAGDGVADDTAKVQAAITLAVAVNGQVYLPEGRTFLITGPAGSVGLMATGGVTITGGGKLKSTVSNFTILQVTGSDVTIRGPRFQGPTNAAGAQTANGIGLYVLGTVGAYVTNFRLEQCTFNGFSLYGSLLEFVDGFHEEGNVVTQIVNTGLQHLSCSRGQTVNNRVDTIGSTTNTYGIQFSRRTTDAGDLATQPNSTDVLCGFNYVANVAFWEGLDSHSGQRITFLGNTIVNCLVGVNISGSNNSAAVLTFAPADCQVAQNTISSGKMDGTASYGIHLTGVSLATQAPGMTATGNIIRGHGTDVNASFAPGAINVGSTLNGLVANNLIIEAAPSAIVQESNNTGLAIVNNTMTDTWSNLFGAPSSVMLAGSNCSNTHVSGNQSVRGAKVATLVNTAGLRINAAQTNLSIGPNQFADSTTPYSNAVGGTIPTGIVLIGALAAPSEATLVAGIDASTGNTFQQTITAARLIGAPTKMFRGQRITFSFIQGGAGGFAITWNAVFKGLTWSNVGNVAGNRTTISFIYDGANWCQDGAQAPYAA